MPNYRPGRSSRTGGNAGEQLVSFTMHDAQRINRVVGIVERARKPPSNSYIPKAVPGSFPQVHLARFSGDFPIGTIKPVQISEDGSWGRFVQARNLIHTVAYSPNSRSIYLALIDEEYHVIGFACG